MSETEPTTPPTSAPLVPKVPPPAPRKPQIGDSIPGGAPAAAGGQPSAPGEGLSTSAKRRRRRSRGGGGGGGEGRDNGGRSPQDGGQGGGQGGQRGGGQARGGQGQGQGGGRNGGGGGGQRGGQKRPTATPIEAVLTDDDGPVHLDAKALKKRQGRQRNGRAVGRYQMNVHVDSAGHTHIAVLEGRSLIEHYVSRPSDDVSQIHGNIYLGRVENVLPGMEAAFIDIATPKNAVLYRGDVHLDHLIGWQIGVEQRRRAVEDDRRATLQHPQLEKVGEQPPHRTQRAPQPGRRAARPAHRRDASPKPAACRPSARPKSSPP